MAKSPVIDQTVVLTKAEVKLGGNLLKDYFTISHIDVRKAINRITTAEVGIYDGDPAAQEFDFVKECKSKIKPGEEIEITAGYEEDGVKIIFKGIITAVSLKVQDEKKSRIVISAADKCILMCENRISKEFKDTTDSGAVNTICGDYPIQKQVSSTTVTHKRLVQYNTTDWDFIISRAEANERVVIVDQNKLKFIKPGQQSNANWKCEYGVDFYSMNLKIDGFSQFKEVKCKSWDPAQHQVVIKNSSEPQLPTIGAFTGTDLASNMNKDEPYEMHSSAQLEGPEVEAWAKSSLLKSRLSRIKGTILFQGVNDIELDHVVEISKTEGMFDGKAYVSGINHRLEESNFITEVTVGMDNEWFIEETPAVMQTHSASLMPGVKGLLVAKVKGVKQDPDGEYRVKLNIPFIKESEIWGRLSNLYASAEFGSFWYPEVDDEVIVGFMSGDPRFPIVLGSLYSKKNKPHKYQNIPQSNSEHKQYSNYAEFDAAAEKMQGFVTKNKLRLSFLDDQKVIVIETPGGRTVFLDDAAKKIFIEDPFKNTMEMNDKGFIFNSPNDFKVEVDGNIELTAKQEIKTESTRDTTMKGMNISHEAQTNWNAKGMQAEVNGTTSAMVKGATATLSGDMTTTVKASGSCAITGMTVMIN